jgi:hypothetical protein
VAGALLGLINDDRLRRRMAQAAIEDAARYDPERVSARYEALLRELLARRGRRSHRLRGTLLGGACTARDALLRAGYAALHGGRA